MTLVVAAGTLVLTAAIAGQAPPSSRPSSTPADAGAQAGAQARARALEHLALVEQAVAERHGPQGETWRTRIKSTEPDLERSLDWLIQNGAGPEALRLADGLIVFWVIFGEGPHARQRLTQV